MSKKQKEQKKKAKERDAKAKVAFRRTQLREQRKIERLDAEREKEAHEIVHGKSEPIYNDPAVQAEREARRTAEVSEKLKKNLEILEALEREYEQEQAVREQMNVNLESEGHKTMREKMDALHEKALALTNKAEELADAKREYANQLAAANEPSTESLIEKYQNSAYDLIKPEKNQKID